MPTLFPALNSKEDLVECQLIIAVVDYDMTNDDDLLGTVILPFSKILEATSSGAVFEFNEDIISMGKAYGKLSGSLRLIWPGDADYSMNNARSARARTNRKCIIM